MTREMCWLATSASETKILHLRTIPNSPWHPYTVMGQFAVPDYRVPGGSKGWATYQKLLKAGWTLVPSTPDGAATNNLSQPELAAEPVLY